MTLGANSARATRVSFYGDFHRALSDLKFAPLPDGRLQAVA